MIYTSKANSWISPAPAGTLRKIEFDEQCVVCDRRILNGRTVVRHDKTHRIICLLCIADLANIQDER